MKKKRAFSTRAKNCLSCKQKEELNPKDPGMISCKQFGWLIKRNLAASQAVCKK